MKYMGSKAKYAKEIYTIIINNVNKDITNWVEPFVGGGNMIAAVPENDFPNRYGFDNNMYVIKLFQQLQKGWEPPENVSESEYKACQENYKTYKTDEELALAAFIGIGCSYAGKWFGGYARSKNERGEDRNHANESRNNLLNQLKYIKSVIFDNKDYRELKISERSIIYCDPPYAKTTKYNNKFDSEEFWNWCNKKHKEGHKIFVSEYRSSQDWKLIWEKKVNNSLTKNIGAKQGIERLFTK